MSKLALMKKPKYLYGEKLAQEDDPNIKKENQARQVPLLAQPTFCFSCFSWFAKFYKEMLETLACLGVAQIGEWFFPRGQVFPR